MNICIQSGDIPDRYGFREGYRKIREAGFDCIDWNLDHAAPSDQIKALRYEGNCIFEKELDEIADFYEPELSAIRENGLSVSQAHAVFPAYVEGHPEVLDWTVGVYKKSIAFMSLIGVKNLVVHGISLAGERTPKETEALNMKLYESLVPALKDNDVTVCLENLFTGKPFFYKEGVCSDPHEAVRMIDHLNALAGRRAFGLCLDTGHLNLLDKDIRAYAPILGERIRCFHIHDNRGNEDSHLAPLTGTVNWTYFVDTLREIGYEGDLSFETYMQDRAAAEFDEELVMPWLRLVAAEGRCFRKRILNG